MTSSTKIFSNKILICLFLPLFFFLWLPTEGHASPDAYEPDNILRSAKPIQIHDSRPAFSGLAADRTQSHNFYNAGDEDWVKFYANKDQVYTIKVTEPGAKCNVIIGIYNRRGDLLIPEEVNDEPAGQEEYAEFTCKANGVYYARIRQSNTAEYGEGTDYKLRLFIPVMEKDGFLYGDVTPCVSEVTITTSGQVGTLVYSKSSCSYSMPHKPSGPSGMTFRLTASAEGYQDYENDIVVTEIKSTREDITLTPVNGISPCYHSADCNPRDGEISLSEMLRVSQLLTYVDYHCDPSGEDGYALGDGDKSCSPHDSDYSPQNWQIELSEMLRIIQLWNMGYHSDLEGEDGFATGRR